MNNPDYILHCSYGNDSVALLQYFIESDLASRSVVIYSDTGWAVDWWPKRVDDLEEWALRKGFTCHQIRSNGMRETVMRNHCFPNRMMRFCTSELKIMPATRFMDTIDPEKQSVVVVGVRREESTKRANWPEWVESSDRQGGRSLWSPLVRVLQAERDDMIRRAGFEPLPHRSRECFPCINANKGDLRDCTEAEISKVEQLEQALKVYGESPPRVMFNPNRVGAVGIREIIRWAHSPRGKYRPEETPDPGTQGCDSGVCGD